MVILVTGAAGYVGSVMIPELLRKGHRVIALDNFMYQQASLLDLCFDERFEVIRGDARDERLLRESMKKVDALFPLACLTGAPLCDRFPSEAQSVNLDAIKLILKLRSREQRVIFPTTNSGYGIGEPGKHCDENSPLRPVSLYGRLKTEAERAVLDGGNCVTFRLATAFGTSPRMRLDLLVNDFVYRAVQDGFLVLFQGHFRRNYIHVRDIASAFLHALEHFDEMKDEPYNVGLSDCNISKKELCAEIKKQIPQFYFTEAQIGEDPDQRDYIVSNAKIEKTGFRPKFTLQDGIVELIKAYRIIKRNQYANV
jgi:nucleoside-diphosphate-sugar epimerase